MSRIHVIGINSASGSLELLSDGNTDEDVAAEAMRKAEDYSRLFYIRPGFEVFELHYTPREYDTVTEKINDAKLTLGAQQPKVPA